MRKIGGNAILIIIPLIVVFVFYNYYATSGDIWSVQCSFHDITGWLCPGCGGQRAFYHLLHGNVLTALHHNLLILAILPVLIYTYVVLGQIYLVGNKKFERYLNLKAWYAYAFLLALVLFFILRNIPVYPFTILAP